MEIWEEPVRGGYAPQWLFTLPYEERFKLFEDVGVAPPLSRLLGLRPLQQQLSGEAFVEMPATRWLCSPQGRIPLGVLTILADLAWGISLGTTLEGGWGFTTAELSLTRVREPAIGGMLKAHGQLIHADERLALSDVRIEDSAGLLVAAGQSRLALFPPPDELPEVPEVYERPAMPEYDTPDPWEREPRGEILDREVWAGRSGLEVLEAQIDGELGTPPIGLLTGLRVDGATVGRAEISMPASEWFATPGRTVQGGVTAMIADAALACAIQTTVERGDSFMPVDVKVNHLRPVMPGSGRLTAEAEVTHRGRSIAIAHATVRNAEGKPVAIATGSALIDPAT